MNQSNISRMVDNVVGPAFPVKIQTREPTCQHRHHDLRVGRAHLEIVSPESLKVTMTVEVSPSADRGSTAPLPEQLDPGGRERLRSELETQLLDELEIRFDEV